MIGRYEEHLDVHVPSEVSKADFNFRYRMPIRVTRRYSRLNERRVDGKNVARFLHDKARRR